MNCETEVLPLNLNGRGKRYGNRYLKKQIAESLEYCIGNNLPPTEAARLMNFPKASLYKWLTNHWYYAKIDNPIILTLKSKV